MHIVKEEQSAHPIEHLTAILAKLSKYDTKGTHLLLKASKVLWSIKLSQLMQVPSALQVKQS